MTPDEAHVVISMSMIRKMPLEYVSVCVCMLLKFGVVTVSIHHHSQLTYVHSSSCCSIREKQVVCLMVCPPSSNANLEKTDARAANSPASTASENPCSITSSAYLAGPSDIRPCGRGALVSSPDVPAHTCAGTSGDETSGRGAAVRGSLL